MQHGIWIALALGCALVACGGGGEAAAPDAFATTCGAPGDQGNEVGVGHFCETLTDCSELPDAPLCSNIGDETTWFCTRLCDEGDNTVCGTGAECTCGNGGCGCTPSVCLE